MKRRCRLVLSIALTLGGVTGFAENEGPLAKVSKPFQYAGYSSPEYRGSRVFSEYVPMPDGVQLAVDVCLPADGPPRDAFPVIFQYTPYRRARVNPKTGAVSDLSTDGEAKFFLSHGYALVAADMRGTGASMGWMMDFMPRLAHDGKELVDWIAAQPWCDGNVGMMGDSYLGWSQTATGSQGPKALKCIAPSVIPLDGYTGERSPGGIYLHLFYEMWAGWMHHVLRNEFIPRMGVTPAKPAVDEDGDGVLADEVPVDINDNGSFLDDGFPPAYADGQQRKHLYFSATKAHDEGNYDYAEWASKTDFINDPSPLGPTMYEMSPGHHVPGLMASGIPIYHIGGWFDGFTRGSFELFCTMQQTNPSRLLMPPSYHGFTSGAFWKHFGHDGKEITAMALTEHLRFFDRYLKGIRNSIDTESPLLIYVMNGGGWRSENEWPLARQVTVAYYLDAGNTLARKRTEEGADAYQADFTHSSRFGSNSGNRMLSVTGLAPDVLPIRTEMDKQCLVYTSEPLAEDTEITGHPLVHLSVSSTARDGDFYVYLEDVDADGEAILVTEGQLRASFHRLFDNDAMIDGGKHGIEVLPELPWHGYERSQHHANALAEGTIIELVIDVHPTSWVFQKDHRLRLAIACADYPTFALHPKLSPENNPKAKTNSIPTVTIHRSAGHPSRIVLPVIPAIDGASRVLPRVLLPTAFV